MRVLDTPRAYERNRREIRVARRARLIIHQSSIAEKNPRRARWGGAGGAGAGSGRTSSGTSSCLAAANASATFAERGTGRGGSANRPVSREKTMWVGRFVHAEATWKRSRGHAPPRRPRRTPGRSARRLSCAARGRAAACAPRAETRPRPSDDAPRSASGGETRACLPSLLGTRAHTRPTPKRSNRFLRTDYLVTKKTKNHHISREFKLPVETACVAPSEGAP